MKIALFGAGHDGRIALDELGEENVACFIDNSKNGSVDKIPIRSLDEVRTDDSITIFITSKKYEEELSRQLIDNGIEKFFVYQDGKAALYRKGSYTERLDSKQWGALYNESLAEEIKTNLQTMSLSIQSREMLRLTKAGNRVLEIGCGSGETSLALAKEGRLVTAIDYSEASIQLVRRVSETCGYEVHTYCLDAAKPLPFEPFTFDVAFQAGLLEHFTTKQRIELLMNWKNSCRKMVSLIPNAHCLAYRIGKSILEETQRWKYGLEMPQPSLRDDFMKAGFVDITEYTVGIDQGLTFLPKDHYMRIALEKWLQECSEDMADSCGQGYLLVTVGTNPEV